MLQNVDGSVMMAQTVEEHRKQGLVMWLIEAFRHQKHALDDVFWGNAGDGNDYAVQNLLNIGVDVHFDCKCEHLVMQKTTSKL